VLTESAGWVARDSDPIVARLAELWALLAELDPEVGRRLAGYQALSAPTDLWANEPNGRGVAWTDGFDFLLSGR
jgi:hypothetical protein